MKKASIQFIASERLNTRCDEILNCDIESRISDQGFTDWSKVMIRPKAGAEKQGRLPSSIGSVRDIIWFTNDTWVKTGYITKGGEVYKTTYRTPGKFLWKFINFAASSTLSPWDDGDYFIAHQKLYSFTSGISAALAYVWTDEYDNEADLFADFPTPEANLFTYLKDTDSVYYSAGGYWIPFSEHYDFVALWIWNNSDYPAYLNTVSLPTNWTIDGSSTLNATVVNYVNAGALASPEQYVGSYLIITSWTYTGKYWYILQYTSWEFIIPTLGNALPILNGTTFSIFAKKGAYLQITNNKDEDKYYNGTNLETRFQGFVKRQIIKMGKTFPNGGPGIIRNYGNICFTSIGDTVFIGDVSQVFWFNIDELIDLQKSTTVDDFFVWKNRMIAYGNNFTTFINPSVSSWADRTFDFKNYGIVPGSCAEVLDDFWLLTYGGQIIPLSETVYGTVIEKKNIGTVVYRYLKTMKNNVCSCFDGRKYYIYGEEKNEEGYLCVYDTLYTFWSVQTGIRPNKFVVDSGKVYYVEYGTGALCKLVPWKVTDVEQPIDQYISSKDIDWGQVFLMKGFSAFWLFLDNRNQAFDVEISHRTNKDSFSKSYPFIVNEKKSNLTPVLWYDNVNDVNLVPHFIHYPLSNDLANVWRWWVRNTGNNGFYLNQMELTFMFPEETNISNVDL